MASQPQREKHIEERQYTWGTRPRRLADKRSIHAARSRLRQFSRRLVRQALSQVSSES